MPDQHISQGRYLPPRLRKSDSSKPSSSKLLNGFRSSKPVVHESTLMSTKEQMEKRKQKFSMSASKTTDYGLISRGEDSRLQRDAVARREYFDKIQQEFLQTINECDVDQITASMSKLSFKSGYSEKTFDRTLMQLRKLREALLRFLVDDFAKSVFLFSIRVSSRVGHYQTYVPSITHLLKNKQALNKLELEEVATLYILHLAHFNNNNLLALETYFRHIPHQVKLREVLQCWRNDDYLRWIELYSTEHDASRKRIMGFGENRMVYHAIKCVQKAYNQLPRRYIHTLFHKEIEQLQREFECSWEVSGEIVLMKTRK